MEALAEIDYSGYTNYGDVGFVEDVGGWSYLDAIYFGDNSSYNTNAAAMLLANGAYAGLYEWVPGFAFVKYTITWISPALVEFAVNDQVVATVTDAAKIPDVPLAWEFGGNTMHNNQTSPGTEHHYLEWMKLYVCE
jgi:hypothetical protein